MKVTWEHCGGVVALQLIVVRFEQSRKQLSPREVTDEGITIDVSIEHHEKHCFPKDVTDDGMVIDVSPKQL